MTKLGVRRYEAGVINQSGGECKDDKQTLIKDIKDIYIIDVFIAM